MTTLVNPVNAAVNSISINSVTPTSGNIGSNVIVAYTISKTSLTNEINTRCGWTKYSTIANPENGIVYLGKSTSATSYTQSMTIKAPDYGTQTNAYIRCEAYHLSSPTNKKYASAPQTFTITGITSQTCGNSIIEGTEQCDTGTSNGIACTPNYGSSCSYCSSTCTTQILQGGYCGDNIINGAEQCDDANANNNDGCTTSCETGSICGNNVCEETLGESKLNCQTDCVKCGDNVCDSPETWQTCANDCSAPNPEVVVDRIVESSPNPIEGGQSVTIHVKVKETSGVDATNQFIECGIFVGDYVRTSTRFSIIGEPENIEACASLHPFVAARRFSIQGGTTGDIYMTVQAPTRQSYFKDGTPNFKTTWNQNDFYAVCGLYKTCEGKYETKSGKTGESIAWTKQQSIVTPVDICGDNFCGQNENANNCATDCNPVCGNNACEPTENFDTCTNDCKTPTDCRNIQIGCPDDRSCAEVASTWQCILTPPNDCRTFGCSEEISFCTDFDANSQFTCTSEESSCGNSICETGETYVSCDADCDRPIVCGDNICDSSETFSSCVSDCIPPAVCGDDICQEPETAELCEQDCALGARCGDSVCHISENEEACKTDCGSFSTEVPNVISEGLSVSVIDDTVYGIVKLKNKGAAMTESWIIEMRPRKAQGTFSFFGVSEERLCDQNFPNNIHKSFQLDAGQDETILLQTSLSDGLYDLNFISAKKCINHLTADEAQNYDFTIRSQPFETIETRRVLVGNASTQPTQGIDPLTGTIIGTSIISTGVGVVALRRRRA